MLDQLDTTPAVFPVSLEGDGPAVVLARMDRDAYERSVFLDQRMSPASKVLARASLDQLEARIQKLSIPDRPVRLLLHTGFCGSTLLARMLDLPGRCLSYKEPLMLHQASVLLRGGERERVLGQRVVQVCRRVYARTFEAGERALIKPSDTAFNAADAFLADGESRALVLYDDLGEFVVSMMRDAERLKYARSIIPRAPHDLRGEPGLGSIDLRLLRPAEGIGLLWLATVRGFERLRESHGERVRFLNAARVREDATSAALAAARALGADDDEIELLDHHAGDASARHSKGSSAFDPKASGDKRAADRARLETPIARCTAFVQAHGGAIRDRFAQTAQSARADDR